MEMLPVDVFPFNNHSQIFLLLLGLWGCGQRAALSKHLWSTHRVVHQVRQIHSRAVANYRNKTTGIYYRRERET